MNIAKTLHDQYSSRLQYGAPLGAVTYCDDPEAVCYLQNLPLDSGGYVAGCIYYGHGAPIYCAMDKADTVCLTVRAWTRKEAKEKLLNDFPQLRFKK